ncbi:MAG: redox-regulated ATPase YchF [bacterium]|nr:redox-regulated ATPase YchF [bacterium]
MSLSVGIAGLPNVGKSTLLNALTQAHAEASNYPFCTIEQNVGVTPVPDPDLRKLEEILSPQETVPTTIKFVDIAGLVEGASRGEGLGNEFLGHIREVDALVHVVRCFEDENIVHSTGAPDPVCDVGIVETEFLLADLQTAQRGVDRWSKVVRTGKGEGKHELAAFEHAVELLEKGTAIGEADMPLEDREILAEARFLTAKPVLYLANTDENDPHGEGPMPTALAEFKGKDRVVPVSIQIEEEIAELPPEEQGEFLEGLGLDDTALDLVVTGCYRLLDLITFYTIANDKLSAWQLPRGDHAEHAAGRIHGDLQKGFIRAEVMSLKDLYEWGNRAALHDHGLIHTVGRDHEVQDKDVLHIHFNV